MPLTQLDSSQPSARPLHLTTPDPRLLTLGPGASLVQQRLGWTPLPWQRTFHNVANTLHRSGVGWHYKLVVVTTPRQVGKTVGVGSLLTHRAMVIDDSRHWYTAQSGLAARKTWRKWRVPAQKAFPGLWDVRRGAGEEIMQWIPTGGAVMPFPPTPEGLHGEQADTVVPDEAWWMSLLDGDDLMQAVSPTKSTRPWSQTIVLSTAGNEDSVWFRGLVDRARESVGDPTSTTALIEYACPDDLDPYDPDAWPLYHPGYGYLIGADGMHEQMTELRDGFRRAFGNQWPSVETSWRAGWPLLLVDVVPFPRETTPIIAIDADPAHKQHAIVAVGSRVDDDRLGVEVIDVERGVDGLVDRTARISSTSGAEVVVQRSGPLGYLIPDMERAGIRVIAATSQDYADAATRFKALVAGGRLVHQGDPRLNSAVENATTRKSGDRDVWARRDTTVEISTVVAASLAAWRAATPTPEPMIVFA